MIKRFIFYSLFSFVYCWPATAASGTWDRLSPMERQVLDQVLAHWETWVPAQKQNGTAPLMTFEDLYRGLTEEQKGFLNRIRKINPRKDFDFQGSYLGEEAVEADFVRIENQWITKRGKQESLPDQYLPRRVHEAYQVMISAMQRDIGRKLLVESGYRSPAYQLYTFLFYMPKHGYSLKETGRWVALPGYSEHGAPLLQAIDFINEAGINGEDDPEAFERLPEYEWLMTYAGNFGFEISYPRNQKGITFEPWHWRYIGRFQGGENEYPSF